MRRELIAALIFMFLAFVAFLPIVLIELGKYPGDLLERIEALLTTRESTIIALGTLFLVLRLSVWAGHLNNRSAESRERINRRTQAEMKISDFRQIWINELRDDLARLVAVVNADMGSKELEEYQFLWTRVQLRLNPNDEEHNKIVADMAGLTNAIFTKSDFSGFQTGIQTKANSLLKAEWDRLKRDLKRAQDQEADEI